MASADLRWHPDAVADAEGARDWYMTRSPLAAMAFLRELERAVEAVATAPERAPGFLHSTRRHLFAHRFPYALIYRPGPPVEIVAVAHQHRRPGFWRWR